MTTIAQLLREKGHAVFQLGRMRPYTRPCKRWRKRMSVVWLSLRTEHSSVSYRNETMLETSF